MSTLSDTSQSNIGWVYPPQPQTEVTTIEEVIGVVNGVTPLVEDQDYVDVVFGSTQPSADWVMLEASIFNLTDSVPINVWPGVVTSKTSTGFRLQLNGTADSGNYYLTWSIRGVFGYYLSGPTSSRKNVASTPFTVRLPDDTTLTGSVIITPSDGGVGGTFTPSTVELTVAAPSATFTYTPTTYGLRSISVSNNIGLINPAQIAFTATASTYTFSGPSSGSVGVPSTDFTVALPVGSSVEGTVIITPSDAGDGGTFTPTTVNLTTAAPSATFTYTAASSGAKTLSVTNNGGLTNPANLTYTTLFDPSTIAGLKVWLQADALSLSNNDPVGTWTDSSGNGNDATQATAGRKPLYKTNIVNGKPVVRFDGSDDYLATPDQTLTDFSIFIVHQTSGANTLFGGISARQFTIGDSGVNDLLFYDGFTILHSSTLATARGSWNLVEALRSGATISYYEKGVARSSGSCGTSVTLRILGGTAVGGALPPDANLLNGDIAEVLIYNVAISGADRADVEAYIATKYGL